MIHNYIKLLLNLITPVVPGIHGISMIPGLKFTWVIISSDHEVSLNIRYSGNGTTPPITLTVTALASLKATHMFLTEIEKHLEADHNAQPEIANLIIKMVQELQQIITKNNELKRELNDLREMLKASVKGSNLESSDST